MVRNIASLMRLICGCLHVCRRPRSLTPCPLPLQGRGWQRVAQESVILAALVCLCPAVSAQAPSLEGLLLWLKADAITGTQSGAALASWPDSSGHNRAAAQTDAARQPVWVADGLNGKPAVRFAGKQWLATPQDLALPHAHTIFVVACPEAGDENGVFLWFENDNGTPAPQDDKSGPACGSGRSGTSFRIRNYPGFQDHALNTGSPAVFSVVAGGEAVEGYVSGMDDQFQVKNEWTGAFDKGAKVGRYKLGAHGLGGNQFLTGDLAEVLVYDRALSREERQAVEAYLGGKWGLPTGGPLFLRDDQGNRPVLGNSLVSSTIAPNSGAWVLGFLYNAGPSYTTEWVAEDVYVPAGKEWEAESVALPFRGLSGLQCTSPRLLADVVVERAELRDYVAAGGGLFIFGGHVAYGAGGWDGSVLEDLLPDVDLTSKPQCYYYHDVQPKPDALVVLTVDGGKPFLVARKYEKGYVVCFTGTPVGDPRPEDNPFWDWNGWATVLRNCFFWASNQHGAFR